MKWVPDQCKEGCDQWLQALRDLQLLGTENGVSYFLPPFDIEIDKKIFDSILKLYRPDEEKGGLMFATIKKGQTLTLKIESIRKIRNVVEKYYDDASKATSYLACPTQYKKLLSANFSKVIPEQILIPIHFHTHPTKNDAEGKNYLAKICDPHNMSDQDIIVSRVRCILIGELKLFYLNAIITGDEKSHRILFYGHKVMPENYTMEKFQQISTAFGKLTDKIENEEWRVFAKVAGTSLAMLAAVNAPHLVKPALDHFAASLDKGEFWAKLKNGKTIVKIPVRDLESD